jgi:hypothetical protein
MKILSFTFLFFLFTSCNYPAKSKAPERVKSIPQDAFWCGGSDGGNWYVAKNIDSVVKKIHFKIYNDFTGELEIDKDFTLHCANEYEVKWDNIKEQINFFDGKRIGLIIIKKNEADCYFE